MFSLRLPVAAALVVALAVPCLTQTITHSFIAIDESRDSLVYTDENNPSANWSVHIDKSRDLQLVGNNRVMLSNTAGNGFTEYDLTTGEQLRDVRPGGIWSVQSCRRLPNGNTILVGEGINVWTIDPDGNVIRHVEISGMSTFRVMRMTADNTYLLGSGDELVEADTSGTILRRKTIDGANNMYMAVQMPDKKIVMSGGYGRFVAILDSSWNKETSYGGPDSPPGYSYNFFAGMQVLDNGHVVVSNWLGHGYNDGANGIGLIEYDTNGGIVWDWMDHDRVSSLHAVIILDGLDTQVLNDERLGTIGPVDGTSVVQWERLLVPVGSAAQGSAPCLRVMLDHGGPYGSGGFTVLGRRAGAMGCGPRLHLPRQ